MDEHGFPRRTTRAALAEIPARLGQLRVSPPPIGPDATLAAVPAPPSPDTPRHALAPNTRDNTPGDMPSNYLSPTPSPDELVIQQRGRKRMPVQWSPDIDFKKHSPFQPANRTPPKSPNRLSGFGRNGIVLRSSPKKRLLLHEFDKASSPKKSDWNDVATTPTKSRNSSPIKSPPPKRMKIENHTFTVGDATPLDTVLKAMSQDQLIAIIKGAVASRPELEKEIRQELPAPDLKPLEEKLIYLKRNVYRSLPVSRLTSKTDSPAYSRAATHLLAFKKQLVDQGRTLVESSHWPSVLEYSTFAWSCTRATPLWDNHPHNSVRRQCFKYLAGLYMSALKKGQFNNAVLKDVYETMEGMVSDSDDIQSCMKWIDVQVRSTPES